MNNFPTCSRKTKAVFPSPKAPLWSSAVGRPRPSTPPPPGAAAARSRPAAAVPLGRKGTSRHSRRRLTGGAIGPKFMGPSYGRIIMNQLWEISGVNLYIIDVHSCWPYMTLLDLHWTSMDMVKNLCCFKPTCEESRLTWPAGNGINSGFNSVSKGRKKRKRRST